MSKNRSARARQNRQNRNNNAPANISLWNEDWVQRPITANLDTEPSCFQMFTRTDKGFVRHQVGMNGPIPHPTTKGSGVAYHLVPTILELYKALVRAEKTAKKVFGVGIINGYLYDVAMIDGGFVIAVEGETIEDSDLYIDGKGSPALRETLQKIGYEMLDGIFGSVASQCGMAA